MLLVALRIASWRSGAVRFRMRRVVPHRDASRSRSCLGVYRPDGTRVATLANRIFPGGAQSVLWNGRDERGVRVASGPYVYRLEAAGRTESIKMVLVQ